MNTYILTTQAIANEEVGTHESRKLISIEQEKADTLIKSGQAIRVNTDTMQKHETNVEQAVSQAKRKIDNLRNSDNPYYSNPDVLQYEINVIETALADEVTAINAQWSNERDSLINEASDLANNHTVRVAQSDRDKADGIISGFLMDVQTENKADALADFQSVLASVSPAVRQAVKSQYKDVETVLNDKYTTSDKIVTMAAINRQAPEKLAKFAMEQLPESVDDKYRQYTAVKQRSGRINISNPL